MFDPICIGYFCFKPRKTPSWFSDSDPSVGAVGLKWPELAFRKVNARLMYSLGEMGTGLITRQFFKLGSTVLEIAPKNVHKKSF